MQGQLVCPLGVDSCFLRIRVASRFHFMYYDDFWYEYERLRRGCMRGVKLLSEILVRRRSVSKDLQNVCIIYLSFGFLLAVAAECDKIFKII